MNAPWSRAARAALCSGPLSHAAPRISQPTAHTMAKTSSPPKSAAVRVSTRKKQTVARFRPASADIPSDLLEMIRDVACAAAAKSKVPFETSAVTALEEALEPCLEALCVAALAHAPPLVGAIVMNRQQHARIRRRGST